MGIARTTSDTYFNLINCRKQLGQAVEIGMYNTGSGIRNRDCSIQNSKGSKREGINRIKDLEEKKRETQRLANNIELALTMHSIPLNGSNSGLLKEIKMSSRKLNST